MFPLLQTTINIRDYFNSQRTKVGGNIEYPELFRTETDLGGTGSALGSIISSVVAIAIPLASIAVLLYFLWAGFNWLTAGGDKQKVEDARTRMTNAIIGMTIVAVALVLSYIVNEFFGSPINITGVSL